MKVALYYPWIYLTGGAERTILELTGKSCHQWTIFTNRFEPTQTFPGFAEREVVVLPRVSVERSVKAVARAGWRLVFQRLPLESYDALVVFCEGLSDLTVFRNARRPVLCICLTPLRIAFDAEYRRRYLHERRAAQKLLIVLGSAFFRWIDRRAWRRYAHVFCISDEVKQRAVRGALLPPDRIELVHPAPGISPTTDSRSFGDFFLLPGRIMWTKNIELGIQAFQHFKAGTKGRRFRLVVAGIVDAKSRPYLAHLRRVAGSDPDVEFHVAPSDDQLRVLYETCYAVLFTAFNEDWGIVPVEAMGFGKPVIAVKRGGPCETVQHGVHGFLEEPTATAFAGRMARLADDPVLTAAMGDAGRARAPTWSWRDFVSRIDHRLACLGSRRGPIHAVEIRPCRQPTLGCEEAAPSQVTEMAQVPDL